MQSFAQIQLQLVNERHEREMQQAALARRFSRPSPSIRRAIGGSIVKIGARLAGEPTYELARSR